MSEFPEHPFWDFSLAVYGRKDVAPACLALQEAYGIDVNLLLFCCWAGASGQGHLGAGTMASAMETVADWHREVVLHLRTLRKRLKGGFDGAPGKPAAILRRRISEIEIDAEHIEQLMLAAIAPGRAGGGPDNETRARDAAANIADYGVAAGLDWQFEDSRLIAAVLAGSFPSLPADLVRDLGDAIVSGAD